MRLQCARRLRLTADPTRRNRLGPVYPSCASMVIVVRRLCLTLSHVGPHLMTPSCAQQEILPNCSLHGAFSSSSALFSRDDIQPFCILLGPATCMRTTHMQYRVAVMKPMKRIRQTFLALQSAVRPEPARSLLCRQPRYSNERPDIDGGPVPTVSPPA